MSAVVLAELEVFHSRPIAPTRRVALGRFHLPVDPAPGYGGVLLGGVVAAHIGAIEADLVPDLVALTHQVERGLRVPQPRLRYRFQKDRVGLQRSRLRLVGGDEPEFDFSDVHGAPAQMLLAAVYAVAELPLDARVPVMAAIRRGIGWVGPTDRSLIDALAATTPGGGVPAEALGDPIGWALRVLELGPGDFTGPARRVHRGKVQQRFRSLLRSAHPDHGGDPALAAQRIAELTEARRILTDT